MSDDKKITKISPYLTRKEGDCRLWTVQDALEDTLEAIKAGTINPDMVVICMRATDEDGTFYPAQYAGGNRLELSGLLSRHKLEIDIPDYFMD